MARIGGQLKPNQMWSVIERLDMRVGTALEAKLPGDVDKKYKKISAPVYMVWSDFGPVSNWPYQGDWTSSSRLVTAAKIKTYHSLETLNSGSLPIVGLLNAGVKQVGRLQTYYLLTGAYTDETADEHNVARAIPLAPVEVGARLTVISLRQDGSPFVQSLSHGGALLETMDFEKDFLDKIDARVGYISKVETCQVCDGTMMLLGEPCPLCQDDCSGHASTHADFHGCVMIAADFGFGDVWTRAPAALLALGASLVGQPLIAMVNLEPVDDNEFLLLGFYRACDGMPVPLSIDCPSPGLPPAGAHLV